MGQITRLNRMFFAFFAADIVFIVKDKPHSIFKREGKDLLFTATLPLGKVCIYKVSFG